MPIAESPVLLDGFFDRMIDYALDPLVADYSAVWALTSGDEIPSALHFAILYAKPLCEKQDASAKREKWLPLRQLRFLLFENHIRAIRVIRGFTQKISRSSA